MGEKSEEKSDALIEEVRETRRRLVAEHGGLHGWIKYLRDRQKEHPDKVIASPKRVGD